MKGSRLLQVTGIIMIIGGGLMVLMALIGLVDGFASGGAIQLASVLALVMAVIELVAGIFGAKNWNNPAKVNACFILGILTILASLFSNIFAMMASASTSVNVSNLLFGLVLPVLYTCGTIQLKRSAK